jgi:beta,beta-carotene 9',10'-dioxygenase
MSKAFAVGFDDLAETQGVLELEVTGQVPAWLDGAYLRNGPARFTIAGQRFHHWFDGLAMLHRFGLAGGRVEYRNRYLRSRNYLQVEETGLPQDDQFASSPRRSLWKKIVDSLYFPLRFGDNNLVSLGRLDDCWLALGETPTPVIIDPETLETQGQFQFRDQIIGMITSAHPVYDSQRGVTYNYHTFVFPFLSRYILWRVEDGSRKRHKVTSIRAARPSYMHSFGASDNYLIVTEFPLRLRPARMLLGCWTGVPFIQNFSWTGEDVVFTVVSKDTGQVTGRFQAPAFFAFHHVNAWEDGEGHILVDIVAYADAEVIDQTYFSRLLAADGGALPVSQLLRYRVPVAGAGALLAPEVLSATAFEMPTLNPTKHGFPYRFIYGYGFDIPGNLNDTIYKIDLEAAEGQRLRRWAVTGGYPTEPVFVPRPDAVEEDDGVVLSVLLDAPSRTSFLLVLDAHDLTELARATIPFAIPFGLHGAYAGNPT